MRSVFAQAYYPVSRFQRLEGSVRFANVDDALLQINEPYDPNTGFATEDPFLETINQPGGQLRPAVAAWSSTTRSSGYVGPFYGRRSGSSIAQSLGDWRFTQVTADYRRYDKIVGPVVLATRMLYFGRIGRNADQFRSLRRQHRADPRQHLGLLPAERVHQSDRPEHRDRAAPTLDRLVGTQLAVASVELRFPILNPSFGIPAAIPPIEGALFFDIGMAWDETSTLKWKREAGDDPVERPDAAADLRRLGADQPVRLRRRASRLRDPPGPSGGRGALDVQPRTAVLGAVTTDGADGGRSALPRRLSCLSAFLASPPVIFLA